MNRPDLWTETEEEKDGTSSAPPTQSSEVHDHGAAFQQGHGIQIYYASQGTKSPQALANSAHSLSLETLPRLRDCDNLVGFGIHPAATWNGNQDPSYVRRDIDEDLSSLLRPGAFVLLVGDPTSGKSRTAFEATRTAFPEYHVLRPEDGAEFDECATLPETTKKVIWLDDLDRFLSSPFISTRFLDEALQRQAVLIGTMRAEQLDLLSPRYERGRDQQSRVLVRAARAITARAHILYIDRQWSEQEVDRARSSEDLRLRNASRHSSEYGIAEYLAAGPQLFLEWQNAWSPGLHPRGAALVSVAVDLRRAGIQGAIPRPLLERLHNLYLEQRGGMRLRPESLLDAFHWALEPLHATSSLLIPVENDTYRAFEYLSEAVGRSDRSPAPPDEVWATAIEDFPLDSVHAVGHRAERVDKYEFAIRAYKRLAESGMCDGSFHLGHLATREDRLEEAEFWYRKAISQGSSIAKNNLGLVLMNSGRADEAAEWFRKAVEHGDVYGVRNLGQYLLDEREWDQAEELFLSFIDKTPSAAKILMGRLCIKRKAYAEAEEWLQQAAADNDDDSWFYLGIAHEELKEWDSAISSYKRAMAAGNEEAINNLAGTLHKAGKPEEAEALYRSRLEQDKEDQYVVFNLAGLLASTKRYEEAEPLYRRSMETGFNYAKNNLALTLEKLDRGNEAEELFRSAAAEGDIRAMANLATRCRRSGRSREALTWINRAIDRESTSVKADYYTEMALIQEALRAPNKAMLWYRRAMDHGSLNAAVALGYLQERQGRTKKALKLYVDAAQAGESHALYHLGQFYLARNNLDKARDYLTQAYEAGEEVAPMLAYLALRSGELTRARDWLDRASDSEQSEVAILRRMLDAIESHVDHGHS